MCDRTDRTAITEQTDEAAIVAFTERAAVVKEAKNGVGDSDNGAAVVYVGNRVAGGGVYARMGMYDAPDEAGDESACAIQGG